MKIGAAKSRLTFPSRCRDSVVTVSKKRHYNHLIFNKIKLFSKIFKTSAAISRRSRFYLR